MATDFSYNEKQIVSGGPFKPSGKDMPVDARTRVETYADIASIPNPHVGLKITVKVDETNNNKMTDYIVKSLKADSLGIANSLIDEVVRYVDYLGATSGGGSSSGGASVEIVNDLTTGGANKALSAEQGKVIKSSLDTITTRIDGLELGGNLVLRDVVDGEIFTLDTGTTPTVTYGNIVLSTTTLSVNENANTIFTVKLDKAPTNNQVINIVVNNGYCTVNPTTLTFTSSNYSTTQTVTVNGVHDSSHYSAKNSAVTLSSSNVSSKTINVTINNIDSQPSEPTVTYGNIVLSNTNLAVNENASNTFTVKLDKAPTSEQVVNIAVDNSYCTVNPSSLTFTPSNYSTTQTVTVNGVHDSSNYTNKTSVITLSSISVTNKTVNVTINNIDEQPSETISVQSITLNKTESTLNVGDTEQLTVTISPTNATNKNVTWTTSDDTKATVVNGLVTAIASGNVTITATSKDGNKTSSCSYTVQEVAPTSPLKMFLNAEGGSERYDSDNALIWLDQSGNGKNYTFAPAGSHTNDRIIYFLWPTNTNISLTNAVTSVESTASLNTNTGLTSINFTWDIKLKYSNTAQQVILGNGTNSPNASHTFAITTNAGNIIVRGNYDKIAIVNKLTTTMSTGNFYRITVTNDGSECKLYLNGVFIASCNSTGFTSIASGKLYTSRTDYAYIKYYDKALTETEIQGGIQS